MSGPTLRAKEGPLEMLKSEGIRKKWRNFLFKVSAQTYLLCFKQDSPAKPMTTLLLAQVSRIDTDAVKDASFPFAVHFRGKGSPWILNANSNAQRMEWMEVIQPGSSAKLAQFARPSSPPVATSPHALLQQSPPASANAQCMLSGPQCQIAPSFVPQANSHAWPWPAEAQHQSEVIATHQPLADAQSCPPGSQPLHVSYSASDIVSSMNRTMSSQEHLLSTNTSATQLLRPSSPSPLRPSPSRSPFVSPKRSTVSHSARNPPPKPPPRRANSEAAIDDDGYMLLTPPSRPKRSENTLQSPPQVAPQSASQMPRANPLQQSDQIDQNYLPLMANSDKVAENSSQLEISGMFEKMQQAFSPEQAGLMIEMLQKLQPSEEGSTQPPSLSCNSRKGEHPASTLRDNLEKALRATPDQQSYKMLVTDDSDEKYEARPAWAKAASASDDSKDLLGVDDQELKLTDLLIISRSNLSNFDQIGEGQFGKVFKAVLRRGPEVVEVAVKTTKAACSDKEQSSFMREMRVMSLMMHPNIVRLHGLVQHDVDSPWIVLEYLPHGDLKSFLIRNPRPVSQLVKYMVDISMGMHYLSERGLIHRDLAARNILVGEGELCKVADFGLLKELPKDDAIYHMKTSVPCPVRWMSPESVSQRRFSTASDVWSYGILLWEMFKPSKKPYNDFGNMEVVTKVIEGYRLPVPRECPRVVARIMRACWHHEPSKRPSFLLIYRSLLSANTTG